MEKHHPLQLNSNQATQKLSHELYSKALDQTQLEFY